MFFNCRSRLFGSKAKSAVEVGPGFPAGWPPQKVVIVRESYPKWPQIQVGGGPLTKRKGLKFRLRIYKKLPGHMTEKEQLVVEKEGINDIYIYYIQMYCLCIRILF